MLAAFWQSLANRSGEMLVERNTFEPDSSYLKFSRYRLEASALGAALLHIEAFIQNL